MGDASSLEPRPMERDEGWKILTNTDNVNGKDAAKNIGGILKLLANEVEGEVNEEG